MPDFARGTPRVAALETIGYAPPARRPASPGLEERSMIVRRAAIASLVIACAPAAGCLAPGVPRMPTEPGRPGAIAAIVEPPFPRGRPQKAFTIEFTTFIPANHLVAPSVHPQSYSSLVPPIRLAFAGDDRGFDVDAPSYRARQVVTVIPDETDDADGLREGSRRNLGGITESFDAGLALADGRIDDADRTGAPGGRRIKAGEIAVNTEGMIVDDPIRLGPHRVFVRLRTTFPGGPRNRLIAGSPSIDWDIGITIDTSGPEPIYEVAGTWDGYPAAELYINRQPVFTFSPGAGSSSSRDLLKLLPGYGDLRFARRGRLAWPSPGGQASGADPGRLARRPLVAADRGP
jgi:hypothetical protein